MASLEQPETIKPTEAENISESSQQPSKNEGGSIDEGKDRGDAESEGQNATESDSNTVEDAPVPAQPEEINDDDDLGEPPQAPGFVPRGRPTGPVAGGSKGGSSKPRPTRP